MCGIKPRQDNSHISTYCERPGGKAENFDLIQRVQAFIGLELPKRPNGEEPRRVYQKDRRSRSRSSSKSFDKPQRHEVLPPGVNAWQIGEDEEAKRRHAMCSYQRDTR